MTFATKADAEQIPKLSLMEKGSLLRNSLSPERFNKVARPALYKICGDDPERVHDLVLQTMHDNRKMAWMLIPLVIPPKNLTVTINGIDVLPFGTAAGMDKNGEALDVFGRIFGFQESGTIVLDPREGNKKPRVAIDSDKLDLYNAQGFPSRGLGHFIDNIYDYRKGGGKGIIYASVCGLPTSEEKAVEKAMKEMYVLLKNLNDYVDGFVWNPFSPNTSALRLLREPSVFRETSQLMKELAPKRLRLFKMGPYEQEGKAEAMKLIGSFIDGGGHGLVTTNTKMFPKEQLPDSFRENWGYASAGRSGAFLKDYRLRSVMDAREEFPDSVIIGTGGIYTAKDAYQTFSAGANMVEGYTPYTYYGPALVRRLMRETSEKLEKGGFKDMKHFQRWINELSRK